MNKLRVIFSILTWYSNPFSPQHLIREVLPSKFHADPHDPMAAQTSLESHTQILYKNCQI